MSSRMNKAAENERTLLDQVVQMANESPDWPSAALGMKLVTDMDKMPGGPRSAQEKLDLMSIAFAAAIKVIKRSGVQN